MSRFFKKFYPTILLITVISFLSLANFRSVPSLPTFPHMDKLVHFWMYATLSFALLFDLSRTNSSRKVTVICMVIAVVFATAVGGTMELLQGYLTDTRMADWWDMAANFGGSLMGIWIGKTTLPYVLRMRRCR